PGTGAFALPRAFWARPALTATIDHDRNRRLPHETACKKHRDSRVPGPCRRRRLQLGCATGGHVPQMGAPAHRAGRGNRRAGTRGLLYWLRAGGFGPVAAAALAVPGGAIRRAVG